jgi:hypothetical protein
MTIFENFMKQARADLAAQYRREDIATDQHRLSKEIEAILFWKNFESAMNRLLPAVIGDFIPAVDRTLPTTRYPVITLELPGCLEIKVAFRTEDDGMPLFRDSLPYLVPGIAVHLGQAEVIWNDEFGARYQPVFVASLNIAAAMAEERWLSMDYSKGDKPELRYETDPEQTGFIEDYIDY